MTTASEMKIRLILLLLVYGLTVLLWGLHVISGHSVISICLVAGTLFWVIQTFLNYRRKDVVANDSILNSRSDSN